MRRSTLYYIALILFTAAGCSSEQDSGTHDSVTVATASTEDDAAVVSNTVAENRLVPGKSAGQISLGEDAALLYQKMGKPDAGDAAMQKAVAIWYDDHDPKSYQTAVYTVRDTGDNPPARIRQIRVTSPEYRTVTGMGPGVELNKLLSSFTLVKLDNYPAAEVKNAKEKLQLYDSDEGIAFEVNEAMKCTAVIIHEPGKILKAGNLPLR
ncbi:hypothetical protein [Pedobacter sp. JY14-1]|uniref:hypothetical protein n=1 Tax=Pedobacter sp. JY14-1 TaxID=3034151 RepID=UPI0023E0AB4E|nr:hypothetical protein [Pedobacter sp. JY14-1]